jgi:hypothetical protein
MEDDQWQWAETCQLAETAIHELTASLQRYQAKPDHNKEWAREQSLRIINLAKFYNQAMAASMAAESVRNGLRDKVMRLIAEQPLEHGVRSKEMLQVAMQMMFAEWAREHWQEISEHITKLATIDTWPDKKAIAKALWNTNRTVDMMISIVQTRALEL